MDKWDDILEKIDEFDAEGGVKTLLAVKVGSRARGYASVDSDYDARFVYARSPDNHLRISSPRDQVELIHGDSCDVVGWDLSKFMRLAHNGNPTAFEWLTCPVLREYKPFSGVRELFCGNFSAKKLAWHYLGMARADCKRYLATNGLIVRSEASVKGLITATMSVLSLRWVLRNEKLPPVDVYQLLDDDLSPVIEHAVRELVLMRQNDIENANKPALVGWITGYVDMAPENIDKMGDSEPIPIDVVNQVYMRAVKQASLA